MMNAIRKLSSSSQMRLLPRSVVPMVSTQTTRSLSYFHESRLEKEKELLAQKKHLSSQAPGNQAPWTDPGYRAWTSDPGQMGLVYLLISIPIGGLLFLGIHAYQQSGHDVKIFPLLASKLMPSFSDDWE